VIGSRKLRELTAADVRQALSVMAAGYSSAAVTMGHLALKRAIRHAEANDVVSRNVATLADTPKGQQGRPSKSLTPGQAAAITAAARTLPVMELRPGLKDVRRPAELIYAYIVLSLLAGLRTEEARALRWDHIDLHGDPHAAPPVPPHVAVWRSVRVHGDTKTERTRRTLALPQLAADALRDLADSQARERADAGDHWQDTGLVFTSQRGAALDAANVRKMFKRVCKAAGAGELTTATGGCCIACGSPPGTKPSPTPMPPASPSAPTAPGPTCATCATTSPTPACPISTKRWSSASPGHAWTPSRTPPASTCAHGHSGRPSQSADTPLSPRQPGTLRRHGQRPPSRREKFPMKAAPAHASTPPST
jgi:integrase